MSEFVAKIEVQENDGIRRFLYPFSVPFTLPDEYLRTPLQLTDAAGEAVPYYITPIAGAPHLHFATSLAPFETAEFTLAPGNHMPIYDDSLALIAQPDGGLRSEQQRVAMEITPSSQIRSVVYDGTEHLRQPMEIQRLASKPPATMVIEFGGNPLTAWTNATGTEKDGTQIQTRTEITACKSWAQHSVRIDNPKPDETLELICDFNGGDAPLIFDTGLGSGLYGKIGTPCTEIACTRVLKEKSGWAWSIGPIDPQSGQRRDDYVGFVRDQEFAGQRWFHVVGDGRAVAFAVTELPPLCVQLTARLHSSGLVTIGSETQANTRPIAFGVCVHFLNNIPAIAAATNPQSILLPPEVTVQYNQKGQQA